MQLEVIAFAAGLISSTAAIPQIVRMIRTRKTGAVSYYMFGMKVCSSLLWVGFGFMTMVYSVIFWNLISAVLCTTVIMMKLRITSQKAAREAARVVAIRKVVDNSSIKARPETVQETNARIIAQKLAFRKKPELRLIYSKPAEQQMSLDLPPAEPATAQQQPESV